MGVNEGRSGSGERVIGIDFGMTSVVAAYVPGSGQPPRIIPTENGLSTLAAVVTLRDDGGRPVVGRSAQELLTTEPAHTITGVKRLLGRKIKSQAVQDLAARAGYRIVEGPSGEAMIQLGDRQLSIPEIASLLLNHTRWFAEQHLKEPVRHCVIAVPAYFNDQQKTAVREAASMAGLKAKKLVHEPTAAALAYGYNRGTEARIVVVDMGGVRLDVSVLEISDNVFNVVATGGDPYLGGANIDSRIADWILTTIKRKYGRDLVQHPRLLQKVRIAAEQAKRELSRCKAVDLQIPLATGTKDAKTNLGLLRLYAPTVEEQSESVVVRVIETIRHTLAERSLRIADIDDVILVGGTTRMPFIRRRIEAFFEREARASLPPEEVIALGAALLGESLRPERSAPPTDVVKASIGIALADGRYMRIIDKDSKIPITRRVMIPTAHDNQRVLEVDVFEGEAEDILDTEYLGTIVYQGIADAKAGDARVIVDMAINHEHALSISSPEPGRDGESFEIATTSLAQRKGHKIKADFRVAKGRPSATLSTTADVPDAPPPR
ncbi:MAG: Hsp70 family protein [Deltaproteobacteria bacterium]|nr:Hsp70 family protein [Deltaproteobacteria bacterium]